MKKILSFGEVLVDVFLSGARIGGAPANFSWYCGQLGMSAELVSAVGKDRYGKKILESLRKKGFSLKYIQKNKKFPTGAVKVRLDKNFMPEYKFLNDTAYDNIEFKESIRKTAQKADILYFGTLARRNRKSAETLEKIIEVSGKHTIKFFDINLRNGFYSKEIIESSLKMADILKISSEELPYCAKELQIKGGQQSVCRKILDKFKLKAVVFTRSSEGSIVFTEKKEYRHRAQNSGKIISTVGAGDAFAAAFCAGYLKGADPELAGLAANMAASYVCTRKGAMVRLPEKIRELL